MENILSTTDQEAPDNLTASHANVSEVMDRFHSSLANKQATEMAGLLAEDGHFSATDPTELFDKQQYSDYMAQVLGDSTVKVSNHKVDLREIKIDESGTSATVIEQFKMDTFTPNIPWRLVSHLIKDGDSWKINVLSFNVTPTNAQLEAIVNAVN
ncbi:nuclear transport factor 2 family protein [Rufibacter aurantiacus]|uniref:nuclear transport factor 2 family protein n=1 Tax=Rufibacter aurantiacus TaxID=2817374 RepID=UPI001B31830C|nr:nuclear transport factor 2 family protein [Rufibacter aurantiacus]